ncbi:MAG TPA: GAF and ANTAR domain-containing protein [Actinomycetota bacterium]|nr:GAF and ANTAR domain-containing protein [Actinomycetota bacterium]
MSAPGNGLRSTELYAVPELRVETAPSHDPMLGRSAEIFSRVILGKTNLQQVLQLVADRALELSPDTNAAVVSLPLKKGSLSAFAGNGRIELESLAAAPEPGPGSDAAGQGRAQVVRSLIVEKRWPEFTNRALYCGAQSVLACPLSGDGQVIGSVVFYSSQEEAFGAHQAAVAQAFADGAAVLLSNARAYEAATALSAQLNEALQSRAVIDQAKGILMVTQGISADEAFEKIKSISQSANIKVRELAQHIVRDTLAKGQATSRPV